MLVGRITKFHHPFIGGITEFQVSKMGGGDHKSHFEKFAATPLFLLCYISMFKTAVISKWMVHELKSSVLPSLLSMLR